MLSEPSTNSDDARIQPTEVRVAQQQEAAPLIIDVRSGEEYAAGHVAGAVNIPFDELSVRMDQIAANRPVVTYCTMRHPEASRGERAAERLRASGYSTHVLDGGLPAWEAAGFPVTRGTEETDDE